MNIIECKYNVGEEVSYMSHTGKTMTNKIEMIYITQGQSTYRTSAWVETSKTPVQNTITYKLANTPAGYILSEDSLFKKEEV